MGRLMIIAALAATPAHALIPVHPILPDLPIAEPHVPAPVDCVRGDADPCAPDRT
ncbi:hypothetical protein JQC91_14390 [Jannaschia sp. Os4]|uniref:hypothetical protein n=1 Tax=Jannaschia sp. Os4 TaxID=2807617 RepID=UPI00193AB1B0|nr:hypothetical protein [Jannaschia sp. Os4]MBM2577493.1 hypothetical protein [Jannaschia sp. Os4]